MDLLSHPCPYCGSNEILPHTHYQNKPTESESSTVVLNAIYFSETFATPLARLITPLSRIITILKAGSEGMGLNATARTYNVSKKNVIDWE
jgi:hypothetical protein